jgi:uncharacterized membrane protein (DUF106 family)
MDYLSLIQQYPRASIIIISLTVSLFVTLINYFFLNKEKMKEIKERQKVLKEEMKRHQKAGNQEKLMELNRELLSHSMEMFRHSFKPMLITIIPIILLFSFVKTAYVNTALAANWFIAPKWFWYYLLGAIAGGMIFKKIFRMP